MKRTPFIFSMVIVAALLLAACGTSTGTNLTPGVPGTGLNTTTTPNPSGGFGAVTPTAGLGANPDQSLLTPTTGIDQGAGGNTGGTTDNGTNGAYPAPTTDLTQATPVTNSAPAQDTANVQNTDKYVLLSQLLRMRVNSQDGQAVGNVTGAMIDRPQTSAGETGQDSASLVDARISYLLVSVTGNAGSLPTTDGNGNSNNNTQSAAGNEVLVPWQAFATNGAASTSSGLGDQLALTVGADAIAGAPRYGGLMAGAGAGADAVTTQYWSDRGVGIPVTGSTTSQTTDSMLVRGQIGSVQVTDATGQALGQVRDFAVDRQTGKIAYAILGGGSTFNGQLYLVPMTALNWQPGQGGSLGAFNTALNAQSFQGAPAASSVDTIDLNNTDPVDAYWLQQAAPGLNK